MHEKIGGSDGQETHFPKQNSHEGLTLTRRRDYTLENMGRVFTILRGFGVEFTPQEEYEYDQLFCGIDFADQLTDNKKVLPEAATHVLSFLTGKQDFLPLEIPQNVVENFSFLRGIVAERRVAPQLDITVRRLLSLRSQLSTTNSVPDYIQLTKREGVETAEMAFLFLREELPPNIKKFLTHTNILGYLADNLLDLEFDFAEGKISIKPSKGLKLALKIEIAKQLAVLSWNYPQKQELIGLTKKYIAMLTTPSLKDKTD